jgi:glycerol kinase
MKYMLTLDAGTTSVRAVLVDHSGVIQAVSQQEFSQYFPQPGWHEQDPIEIWEAQLNVARKVVRNGSVRAAQIAAVGITNQRETSILWSRETGEPLYRAINWADRRVAPIVDGLIARGLAEEIREKTGVVPDATFSAPKIMWLLDNVAGARSRAEKGELAWGTVDTWLLWKLTGGDVHATDASNASRTMMFNIHTLAWDEQLLSAYNIPASLLPSLTATSGPVGETDKSVFGVRIPVAGMAGDQQAGLFGQGCFKPGMAKNTFGTAGCFDMNAGDAPLLIDGLVSNVAWTLGQQTEYTVEGVALMSGDVIQWLRDEMKMISRSDEASEIAAALPDAAGVYIVPAHQGLNAPHWDMYARGIIIGCTRGTTREHVVRAAVEAMAYQTRDIVVAVNASGKVSVTELRIDGGGAANEAMCRFLADILGIPVVKPRQLEATALGAAYLAGLGVGFWANREELEDKWQVGARYEPAMGDARRQELYDGWKNAVSLCRGWAKR